MAGQYGTRPDSYLATRHYNGQNGQPGELVSLTDGRHSKGVIAVRGDNMGYSNNGLADNGIYNSKRGFDPRPGFDQFQSGDAVSRVANDIFSHRLQDAELDTRNYMRGRSSQDAERFTQDVNATLARIAQQNGRDQEQLANYLAIHRMRGRDGQDRDVISLTDGVDSKNIAAVAMYPYNRVGMNFDQSGQFPGQPYFDQPPMQTAFDNGYSQYPPAYPPGYAYGYGRHYPPRYYGAANPGYLIGSALSRIFHV